MLPLLMALASRRGQSQNMQGVGGVDPNELFGAQRTAPLQLGGVHSGLQPLQFNKPRDFTNLIYQAGMTPSLGSTALKSGIGVLGEYLKSKYGGGAKAPVKGQATPGINYGRFR